MREAPFRFGKFELVPDLAQLRKSGTIVRLPHQPFRVLHLLVSRAGTVVTREEIRQELWGSETFVDFEHGINAAIRNIRFALNDHAEAPRYLETIPRRGYRFIAAVERDAAPPGGAPEARTTPAATRSRRPLTLAVVLLASIAAGALIRENPSPPATHRVAILPFRVIGERLPAELDARAFAEEVHTRLSRLRPERISVIDPNLVASRARTNVPLSELARATGADSLVIGTIRKTADGARVIVRCVDGHSQKELWTQTHERTFRESRAFPIAVAHRVVHAIAAQVLPPAREEPVLRTHVNAAALNLYRQARVERTLPMPQQNPERALELFHAALRAAPRFAEAWAGIGEVWLERAISSAGSHQMPDVEKARPALLRAIALDPNCAEAQNDYGLLLLLFDHDYAGAETAFRRAVRIDPELSQAHSNLAWVLSAMAKHDEAIAVYHRAQQLDPMMLSPDRAMAVIYLMARRYDEASAEYREVELVKQNVTGVQWGLMAALIAQSQYDEASAVIARMKPQGNVPVSLHEPFEKAYRRLEPVMHAADREYIGHDYVLAAYYAQGGDRDRAFEHLDRAIEAHAALTIYLNVDPRLDNLRSDPRFAARLSKMNLL